MGPESLCTGGASGCEELKKGSRGIRRVPLTPRAVVTKLKSSRAPTQELEDTKPEESSVNNPTTRPVVKSSNPHVG